MANRFSPTVLPRQRPGFFGVLNAGAEGVRNFVESTQIKEDRGRARRREDQRDDIASSTEARAAQRHEIELALGGFRPDAETPFDEVAVGSGTPVFNPDPSQDPFASSGGSPLDEVIMRANGGELPGSVVPSLRALGRISLPSGGSIADPQFETRRREDEIVEALSPTLQREGFEGSDGENVSRAVAMGAIGTPRFADVFDQPSDVRSFQDLAARELAETGRISPETLAGIERFQGVTDPQDPDEGKITYRGRSFDTDEEFMDFRAREARAAQPQLDRPASAAGTTRTTTKGMSPSAAREFVRDAYATRDGNGRRIGSSLSPEQELQIIQGLVRGTFTPDSLQAVTQESVPDPATGVTTEEIEQARAALADSGLSGEDAVALLVEAGYTEDQARQIVGG